MLRPPPAGETLRMPTAEAARRDPAAAFAALAGVWRSHGYGTLLEIDAKHYRLYEETALGWLYVVQEPLPLLAEHYLDLRVSRRRRSFSVRRATGVTRVGFRRLRTLPPHRLSDDPAGLLDPELNFTVLWQTFVERYALFELRGVDWDAAWRDHRDRVTATTGRRKLFAIMCDLLRPLRDGHVRLASPYGHFDAADLTPLYQRLGRQLQQRDDPSQSVATLLVERRAQLATIVRERYLAAGARRAANGLLEWGRLDERTGYLAIHAMARQSGHADAPREDQQAAARGMLRVLEDIGELPDLVIDLRGNGGGYDGVALRLAGYLTDRKRLAFTKAPSKRVGFGGEQRVCVEPRGSRRYRGRIHLLTSPLTASAAEIFVLALLHHPRVTRIGEATQGILSDVMERQLPNGWTVSLSNELYRAADGELYEDRGIPPHVEIPYLQARSLDAGRDAMLDHVLRHAAD